MVFVMNNSSLVIIKCFTCALAVCKCPEGKGGQFEKLCTVFGSAVIECRKIGRLVVKRELVVATDQWPLSGTNRLLPGH